MLVVALQLKSPSCNSSLVRVLPVCLLLFLVHQELLYLPARHLPHNRGSSNYTSKKNDCWVNTGVWDNFLIAPMHRFSNSDTPFEIPMYQFVGGLFVSNCQW